MGALIDNWETLDGLALSQGLPDLRTLPLGRVCNFVYYFLTKDGDEQGIAKFRAKLWQPPVGEVPDERSPWNAANENSALAGLAASLGMAPRSAA